MNIQLIDKEKLTFRFKNIDFDYVKPKYIMLKNEFKLREATVKNGSMWWNVLENQFSYNQLKKAIKDAKNL